MASERLNRRTVIEQAVKLADAEGLAAITIRRLAAELGVTPMALYWHFKNKDELLTALADHLLAALVADLEPGRPWDERLRTVVTTLVEQIRAHPYLAALLPGMSISASEGYCQVTDTVIGLLMEAGFTARQADQVASFLVQGATALVSCQPGGVGNDAVGAAELLRRERHALESLPPGRYPHLAALAGELGRLPDLAGHYSFGIDLLLSAVRAKAPNA